MSMRALVVGYGSPLRGDDALGPLVADRLAALELPAGIEVAARHVLTAELVAELGAVERAVFLDAAVDLPPGAVRCVPLMPRWSASSMAHVHDPCELLAWCEALYGRAPHAWLISAGGAEFGYAHCQLSAPARAAIAPMLARIMTLLDLAAPDATG